MASYKYYLAVVSAFQNEARFLREWIEYHRLVGVEHFYLFDHNNVDNSREILKPYIDRGLVTCTLWKDPYVHSINQARNQGLLMAKGQSRWLANIDTDEFLVPHKTNDLRSLLRNYEDFGGLVINWQIFGTSNVEVIPSHKTLIETLVHKAPKDLAVNRHIKSIVQTQYTILIDHPHFARYIPGKYAVNSLKQRVDGAFDNVGISEIQVNHYYFRDLKFVREVKIERANRSNPNHGKAIERDATGTSYSLAQDQSILHFVPPLRKALGLEINIGTKLIPNKVKPMLAKVKPIDPVPDKVKPTNPMLGKVNPINPTPAKVNPINPTPAKVKPIDPKPAKVKPIDPRPATKRI